MSATMDLPAVSEHFHARYCRVSRAELPDWLALGWLVHQDQGAHVVVRYEQAVSVPVPVRG